MPAEVTREEFAALEREVEGEKMVTRHILEQTRRNSDDLAAIKFRLDRVEGKVDALDRKIDAKIDGLDRKIDAKIDSLDRKFDAKIDGLAKSLPGIVGDAMREVLRERDRKS